MKTSNQLLQSANPPEDFTTPTLYATFKFIWRRLFRALTASNELQVWRKTDRHGHTYWQAHDPTTGKSTSLGSEAEMRVWIEQGYYQQK